MPKHESYPGYVVWTYTCYVIELDPAVCDSPGSTCAGSQEDHEAVYVGQTAHTPEERFQQHKAGEHSAWSVREFGRRLRPDLAGRGEELPTREAAIRRERSIARRLRSKGYCVYGGH